MPTSDDEFSAIDDPGEFNQRRRLKAIQDARERVYKQRAHALDLEAVGAISTQTKRQIIREAVTDLVLEVEQLIIGNTEENQDNPGNKYWTEAQIGAIPLADGSTYPLFGLHDFLSAPNPIVQTWTEEPDAPPGFDVHPNRKEARERREETQIPEEVSMRAFRLVTKFLNDVGLDAQPEETLPTFGFKELEDWEIEEAREAGVIVDDR